MLKKQFWLESHAAIMRGSSSTNSKIQYILLDNFVASIYLKLKLPGVQRQLASRGLWRLSISNLEVQTSQGSEAVNVKHVTYVTEQMKKTHPTAYLITNLFWTADWKLVVMISFMWVEVRSNFIDKHFHLKYNIN